METSEYDGCGRCLVAVRRLSRKTDATSSPQRQAQQVDSAVAEVGGHIIDWADDWEVSGATDPLTRPELGPWLRNELGPYDGIVGASVDRIGRNVRDVLNTGWLMKDADRLLITHGHGVWDLTDHSQEIQFNVEALGAQMELRAIQKRNADETVRSRTAGQPRQKNSYGYRFVRLIPTGKIDHVDVDAVAAGILRDVAERILSDESGTITVNTEAARLTRAGVPCPGDHRAMMYGRAPQGGPWEGKTLKSILISPAALGFLMHQGRPVLGPDGHPTRLADPLWDRATHKALVAALAPKRSVSRAPRGMHLLSGRAVCGTCKHRLYVGRRADGTVVYRCTARVLGLPEAAGCSPAPSMGAEALEKIVTDKFLTDWGSTLLLKRVYDPGTGHAARIAEVEADRTRLRDDRQAGLYDGDDDAEWYRTQYARMSAEITELRALPDRPGEMTWVSTGQTVADQWDAAPDDAARRDILATYQIKAVLYPAANGRYQRHARVWVHDLDPDTEDDARRALAEAEEMAEEARQDAQERAHDLEEYEDWLASHGPDEDAPRARTAPDDDEDAEPDDD